MGPSFGNPKGHFEDIPLVKLHDKLLHINSTDWRYTGRTPLVITNNMLDNMRAYVAQRKSTASNDTIIGAKDPRAVFFLEQWHKVLDGNLKTILVYRDWRYSVSSLLKRHSRELIQFRSSIEQRTVDYDFWRTPTLATDMWLASAEAMIHWKTRTPNETLLFNQNGFVSRQDQLKSIASSMNFNSRVIDCRLFDSSLMQQSIPDSLLNLIPEDIQQACDRKQQELIELSDVFEPERVVTKQSDALTISLLNSFTESEKATNSSNQDELSNSQEFKQVSFKGLSFSESLEALKILSKNESNHIDWNDLICREGLSSTDYDALYVQAVKHGALDIAEIAICRALAISKYHYRYTHLGDTFMRRKMPNEAKKYYQKAANMVPDNAAPLAKLAEVEAFIGNISQSERLLREAKALDETKPAIKQAETRLLQAKRKMKPRGEAPVAATNVMLPIEDYTIVMKKMEESKEEGIALDKEMVRIAFTLRNNYEWLKNGCRNLSYVQSQNLLDYIVAHFKKYWPEPILQTELLGGSNDYNVDSLLSNATAKDTTGESIGVCIHVYYLDLLAEIFSLLNFLPKIKKIVITCHKNLTDKISARCQNIQHVNIVEVENRGRDIYPWLHVADEFADCDLVLKVHTKSTPHSKALSGWRLQLLWQLCGDNVDRIIRNFSENKQLGMIIPKYHPAIAPHINWGQNFTYAQALAEKLKMALPEEIDEFPAGSMFWYRPKALENITSLTIPISDFPTEEGQIDGTIMHAIERVLCLCAKKMGYQVSYVD